MTVAELYQLLMSGLHDVSCGVRIWSNPVEIANPIPFEDDSIHQSYDPEYVGRFWQILLQTTRVFTIFRSRFRGKVSPIHLFGERWILPALGFPGEQLQNIPACLFARSRNARRLFTRSQ